MYSFISSSNMFTYWLLLSLVFAICNNCVNGSDASSSNPRNGMPGYQPPGSMQYKPIMYLTENMRSRPDSSFDSPYAIKYAPAHYAFEQPPAFQFAPQNANFKMGAVTHGVEPPSAMMSIAPSSLFPAFRFGGGDDEAGDGARSDPTMNYLQPGGFNYGAGYNGI